MLVETQADDASRLLAAVTAQPAYVFGNSGGAVTALALLSRHRDQISRLVAHEPPLTELLPDSAAYRAAHDDLYETNRSAGPGARTRHRGAVPERREMLLPWTAVLVVAQPRSWASMGRT